jgi:hypothetical protein
MTTDLGKLLMALIQIDSDRELLAYLLFPKISVTCPVLIPPSNNLSTDPDPVEIIVTAL